MTLDDLRAMGVSDADIAGLLSFDPSSLTIGGGQDEAARALAAAQATGLSNLGYVPVYGGGDIIPGTTQGILSKLGIENPYTPIFQTVGSENSGTAMDATERTTFAPTPGQTYRLVDNRTGETFGEASDPVGIKALVDRANALSEEQGKKANWDLQQSTLYSDNPNQPLKQGWNTIAQDDPNTIPMSIKAMMAAMAVMTGAGVAQQINAANAAVAGAGGASGAGGAGAVGAGAGAGGASSGLVPGALSGLSFAPVASAPIAASAVAPIVVTAGAGGLTAAELAAIAGTAAAGTAATTTGGATSGTTTSATTPAATTPAATTPAATTTAAASGSELAPLTVTAGSSPTNLVPASLLAGGGAATAAAANAAGSTTSAADLAASRTGMTGAEMAAVNAGAGGAGVFGTGLTAAQLATLANLGVSGVSSLFGDAGGGTGATTPYGSPFGAGTNFGGFAGRTQINPNITDYEKYGFGPEAQFFSGAATSPGAIAPPATTPAATTPAATPAATTPATTPATNLLDSAASTGGNITLDLPQGPVGGGNPIVFEQGTPVPISPIARETNTINNATSVSNPTNRVQNLGQQGVFDYYKNALQTAGAYARSGYITPEAAALYTAKLNAAMAAPNASLETIRAASPMPQYTYTAPTQPITDPNRYVNDLYKQIGSQFSQGLLNQEQARGIQGLLSKNLMSGSTSIDALQNIYNTEMQKYKPLI